MDGTLSLLRKEEEPKKEEADEPKKEEADEPKKEEACNSASERPVPCYSGRRKSQRKKHLNQQTYR